MKRRRWGRAGGDGGGGVRLARKLLSVAWRGGVGEIAVFLVAGELVKRTAGGEVGRKMVLVGRAEQKVVFFGLLQFRYEGSSTHAKLDPPKAE